MSLSFHKCRHGLLTLVAAAAILTLRVPLPPVVVTAGELSGVGASSGPVSTGVPLAALWRVLFGSLPATLFWLAVFIEGASLGITRYAKVLQ